MKRREFLKWIGLGGAATAAAVVGVVDVERLLWVPGEKKLFLPPAGGWTRPQLTINRLAPFAEGQHALPGDAYLGEHGFMSVQWMTRAVAEELGRSLGRPDPVIAQQHVSGVLSREPGYNWYSIPRREMREDLGEFSAVVRRQAVTGPAKDMVQVGVLMNTNAADWYATPGFAHEAYVRPAARELARRVTADALTDFVALDHPPGADSAVVVSSTGVIVRGVKAYDEMRDTFMMRFDVLGKASAS